MPTNNRQKILLVAAAVVIGLLIADSFIFEPLAKTWNMETLDEEEMFKALAEPEP